MDSIFTEILKERAAQDAKWGVQHHTDEKWSVILTEEVGEVAAEVLKSEPESPIEDSPLEQELIQVAAVTVAWIQQLRRKRLNGEPTR